MQRTAVAVLVLLVAGAPLASGQVAVEREAVFAMAEGFDDTMLVLSGDVVLKTDDIATSAAYFRTSGAEIRGLSRVCWTVVLVSGSRIDCADGPLSIEVPSGSSFGFKSATPYSTSVSAPHAITTFVDLSKADGFDPDLRVGESAILSMVQGRVTVGSIPQFPVGASGGFTTLEGSSVAHVRGPNGVLLHTMRSNEDPMVIQGKPQFLRPFNADVAVVPFADGATASFTPSKESIAAEGLSDVRMDLLDQVLRNVQVIDSGAKAAPLAILGKADAIVSEIFNGAFIRTSLGDNPSGLGDVGFAKFEELTVTNDRSDLAFDGSYTLVAGDLGPSFDDSDLQRQGGMSLLWWAVILFVVAALAVGAWLWLREGPVEKAEPGPQSWVARVASAIGAIALFVVWDWQLNRVLGSSILTTEGSGGGLGLLVLVELATMLLAALLIGLPVYLAVRYGLALARKPELQSLSLTAAIFLTLGLGLLVLPALVGLLLSLVA